MATKSIKNRSVEILLEHAGNSTDTERYVDMQIEVSICDVDDQRNWIDAGATKLGAVGGKWDRLAKRWAGNATKVVKLRFHRGQEEFAKYYFDWLSRAIKGPSGPQWNGYKRHWSLLLIGGRRSGKSHAVVAAALLLAVMMPKRIIWCISPTQEETDELETALMSIAPQAWWKRYGGGAGKNMQFRFHNGSKIMLLSGHNSNSLKRGRCDMAVYNESQKMKQKGWIQLRGAVADTGGMVLLAANPPDDETGRWIEEVYERSITGVNTVKSFQFNPSLNPFVEHQALLDMEADINDPVTYQREILGVMGLAIGDIVFHQFNSESVRPIPPDYLDVTHKFLEDNLGKRFDFLAGMDFQRNPHNPVNMFRFFTKPASDQILIWCVDEVIAEESDEYKMVEILNSTFAWSRDGKGRDYYRGDWQHDGHDRTVCGNVIDASAWWQDSAHSDGKQTDRILRKLGWKWLFKPNRTSDKNPDVVERVKVTNWLFKSQAGERRLFVLPHCVKTIYSLKNWEMKYGAPYRRSRFAHICDSFSYPLYRMFAEVRNERSSQKYQSGKKFDRKLEMAGF